MIALVRRARRARRVALVACLPLVALVFACEAPPTDDSGADPWVQKVASGRSHTCALFSNGRVRCWGDSSVGQLGYGATNAVGDDETPASVGWVDVGGYVLDIAAGDEHTCAVSSAGGVRCWGNGSAGQLGYGNTDNVGDDERPSEAGDVELGDAAVAVTAGSEHTCALMATGAVRCWGAAARGQLGYGNTDPIGDDEPAGVAGEVAIGQSAVAISAGFVHTCALLDDGGVRCWGASDFGQLGYGGTASIGGGQTPDTVGNVGLGTKVVAISAGGAHTCAITRDYDVMCWGKGRDGALGYGGTGHVGDNEAPVRAGIVPVGAKVRAIDAGEKHTCAVLADRSVRCWGEGDSGRLGYGDAFDIGETEPASAAGDVDVGAPIVQISAGISHTCATDTAGDVRCWGFASLGQLGYGVWNQIGDDESARAASVVQLAGVAVSVSAGSFHSCALLDGGAVRCWGYGRFGRLGYKSRRSIGDDERPDVVPAVRLGGVAIDVAAGGAHSCAVLAGGAVRCWGLGRTGRLGTGDIHDVGDDEHPAAVAPVDVGGPAKQVVAGLSHTCVLLEAGTVRCFGRAADGRLGYGNTEDVGLDYGPSVAGDVDVGGVVVQLTAGQVHTCALLANGRVRCWGRGTFGRLGYASESSIGDDEVPSSVPPVPLGAPAVAIAAGGAHTCALLSGGGVRCWGEGELGQLGSGGTDRIGDDETPESVALVDLGSSAIAIAAGSEHSCAVLQTGDIRCWGAGAGGRLGYGDTENVGDNEVPVARVPLSFARPAVAVTAGELHTCARLDDGSVRCWGRGISGQLGDGRMNNIGDDETPASAGIVPVR